MQSLVVFNSCRWSSSSLRSCWAVRSSTSRIDPGFSSEHLVTASFDPITSGTIGAVCAARAAARGEGAHRAGRGVGIGVEMRAGGRMLDVELGSFRGRRGGRVIDMNWVSQDIFSPRVFRASQGVSSTSAMTSTVLSGHRQRVDRSTLLPGTESVGRRLAYARLRYRNRRCRARCAYAALHEPPVTWSTFRSPEARGAAHHHQSRCARRGRPRQAVAAVRDSTQAGLLLNDVA